MEELRNAVQALLMEVQRVAGDMDSLGDVLSRSQLAAMQKRVDQIQVSLNRTQTALDVWAEEKEEV